MPKVQEPSKPNENISNYEWNITPLSVKILIEHLQQVLQQREHKLSNLQAENQWLREQLNLQLEKSSQVVLPLVPEILLWAMVGLILTIGGTFVTASTISAPWLWNSEGITTQSLGVSFQIGAVLLTGCLGGKNAALLAQLAYLSLGLLGLPIFNRGGGWQYILEPHFGYLLGFVVGAWICGNLAFQKSASINGLMLSCITGFLSIHLVGIVYLVTLSFVHGLPAKIGSISQGIYLYSLAPFSGQLAVICGTVAIAFCLRKLMFS
ncbi:BioY protein [Hyella patelloides LEGE 07179]|uniref:BioY protein n=1 Tax=Hyella patelloides LEGE 07179 TaxID=945734 RepID=A0A563VQ44_9CYAN|nr:biotin transporter BioY [Hyella patelloides]VEP13531.1 BioY protein [Hyella patelloides LEGE 07179]